jgi:DegV family protein with EDD domain
MSANSIAIITDSTCDIPQALVDQYAIIVIPHFVIWGNQEYLDRVNLQPEEFYRRLETDPVRPTSAQATAQVFEGAYQKAIQNGAEEIVALTVSSAMSGAYQMALNAASQVNVPVHVIDSKGPTMSLGWQVLAAARMRAEGGNAQAIIAKTSQLRQTLTQIVGMDTMEYLQRGGRIGDAAKWIGSLLQIKPVVSINHQTGRVEPAGIARTYKSMVEMLYQKFFEKMDTSRPMHVAVLHGNAHSEAEALAGRIQGAFQPVELLINITGPVLGINTGPRALALCGYTE